MSGNIINAAFCGTSYITTRTAWLIDYGMILKLSGIELPEVYEVDFANSKNETATRVLGGPDGVTIPDQYFLAPNAQQIFAWLYLHTGGDDGYTKIQVTIPINKRPDVTDVPPTPEEHSIIEQAIAALNDGVERAETAADNAEAAVEHYPKIVDGMWYVFVDGEWQNTGVQAEGEDGAPGPAGPPGEVTQAEFDDLKSAVTDTQNTIATVEATTTASKNYAVGDLLVYDGKLYEVTSAIATGATITIGTNVRQTTVERQIASSGGETWYTAVLSAADYDSTNKRIVFDVGSGKKLKNVVVAGQIVNDGTQTSDTEKISLGIGITANTPQFSICCATVDISHTMRRLSFLSQFSIAEPFGPNNARVIYPQAFYYGTNTAADEALNVYTQMNLQGTTRATNLYWNFNAPRYLKIELPTWVPQWAYIKIFYTLQ